MARRSANANSALIDHYKAPPQLFIGGEIEQARQGRFRILHRRRPDTQPNDAGVRACRVHPRIGEILVERNYDPPAFLRPPENSIVRGAVQPRIAYVDSSQAGFRSRTKSHRQGGTF